MPPTPRPEPSPRDEPRKQPPASIETDKEPRGDDRRIGPEDEDRHLRDGEERPDGHGP